LHFNLISDKILPMSINTNVSNLINIDKNLDTLISQCENHELSFNNYNPTLPDEVWVGILKRLPWTDLQNAGHSCKYIFVIAQTILKQHRHRWAEAFPEASQWPIPKLIHEVEVKPLFVDQSVLLTFARIMGIDRYRELPVLHCEDVLSPNGFVDQFTPDQITAPIIRGITRTDDRTIQFLAIRSKNDSDAESIFVDTIVNIGKAIGRARMVYTQEQNELVGRYYLPISYAQLCSQPLLYLHDNLPKRLPISHAQLFSQPLLYLFDNLPKLLCNGVLYMREYAGSIPYPRYRQISLV